MRISVVIPTYNRLHTLVRAIDSIKSQTSAVDEIIIVDDGSNDGSSDYILRNHPEIELVQTKNAGVSAARNTGIRKAKFEWIAFLDSDDSWLPEKISFIRDAKQNHNEFQFFHSEEIWVRNGVRVNAMAKHQKAGGWIFEKCLPLCVISPSAVVIRKSLLESAGLFDESLPACEDYDLWLKLCQRHPVWFIDTALITKFGGHADQLSARYWGMDRFRIIALNRLIQNTPLSREHYRAANDILIRKLEILLKGAQKHNNADVIAEFTPLLKSGLARSTMVSAC